MCAKYAFNLKPLELKTLASLSSRPSSKHSIWHWRYRKTAIEVFAFSKHQARELNLATLAYCFVRVAMPSEPLPEIGKTYNRLFVCNWNFQFSTFYLCIDVVWELLAFASGFIVLYRLARALFVIPYPKRKTRPYHWASVRPSVISVCQDCP